MKTIIKLSKDADLSFIHGSYGNSERLLKKAVEKLAKEGLQFNNKNGQVRRKGQVIVKYVNPSDFVPHNTEEEVYYWEFSKEVQNEAWHLLIGEIGIDAALASRGLTK